MSRGSYEARPADLKQVIDAHSGPEAAALFGRAMDEVDVIGRAAAEQAGNTLITLDPAEAARLPVDGHQLAAELASPSGAGRRRFRPSNGSAAWRERVWQYV